VGNSGGRERGRTGGAGGGREGGDRPDGGEEIETAKKEIVGGVGRATELLSRSSSSVGGPGL